MRFGRFPVNGVRFVGPSRLAFCHETNRQAEKIFKYLQGDMLYALTL